MSILEAEHICKTFNRTKVLKDISFSLEKGQALSIIGSSGSGKTTLLRCLNFLETPDRGIIRVNDEILFNAEDPLTMQESAIRKKRLHFGLVFQGSVSVLRSQGRWLLRLTSCALMSRPPHWIRSLPERS